MGVTFKHPRGIPGFTWGESLVWKPGKTYIEKTIAGSIAHFTDGADGVPMKNLVCEIKPAIMPAGKNLFFDTMIIGLWSISNGNKYPASSSNYVCCDTKHTCLGNQEYSLSFIYGDNQNKVRIHSIVFFDENETFVSGFQTSNHTFTTPQNARFFTFNLICDLTISDVSEAELSNIQIEVGSTVTPYEPYTPARPKEFSSVEVIQTGKNILDPFRYSNPLPHTSNGITYTKNADGSIHAQGTATATSYWNTTFTAFDNAMPAEKYIGKNIKYSLTKLSGTGTINAGGASVFKSDGTWYTHNLQPVPNDAVSFRCFTSIPTGSAVDLDFVLQMEIGSTATDYEPYVEPTIKTVQLGQTVYGGLVDVISGLLSIEYVSFVLESIQWTSSTVGGVDCWRAQNWTTENLKLPTNGSIFDGVCDTYTPIRFNGVAANVNTIALRDNGWLHVNNGSTSASPTGHVTIALAEPKTVQLTPQEINTLSGVNNIWNNTGNTSVTYYADPDITPPLLSMLPPPIDTEPPIDEEPPINEENL